LIGLHILGWGELVAQGPYAAGQVHPGRSSLDSQLPGDGGRVEIKEDSQRDHLALPPGQAPYRSEQPGIEATVKDAESR